MFGLSVVVVQFHRKPVIWPALSSCRRTLHAVPFSQSQWYRCASLSASFKEYAVYRYRL